MNGEFYWAKSCRFLGQNVGCFTVWNVRNLVWTLKQWLRTESIHIYAIPYILARTWLLLLTSSPISQDVNQSFEGSIVKLDGGIIRIWRVRSFHTRTWYHGSPQTMCTSLKDRGICATNSRKSGIKASGNWPVSLQPKKIILDFSPLLLPS